MVWAFLDQMGVGRDEDDALRDRLRLLIITAAHGARDQVAAHLQRVLSEPYHRSAKFFVDNARHTVEHASLPSMAWIPASRPE